MSKTATMTLSAVVTGDGLNLNDTDTLSDTTAAVAPQSVTFVSGGFLSVSVPSGVIGVKIKPAPSNAVTLTLKGITGDTGTPLNTAQPTYIALPPGATTIGLTAGAAVTVTLIWI